MRPTSEHHCRHETNSLKGDPTDASIKLRPLEPAAGQALARDLVLKTRRRKGLGDQIAVSKYLDEEFLVSSPLA